MHHSVEKWAEISEFHHRLKQQTTVTIATIYKYFYYLCTILLHNEALSWIPITSASTQYSSIIDYVGLLVVHSTCTKKIWTPWYYGCRKNKIAKNDRKQIMIMKVNSQIIHTHCYTILNSV